jgi:8-oxo-dGTP pyrophosphatase MutT (NUDIX family)
METAAPATPVIAHPASTVLLLRDGPAGLEVFMVTRHHQSSFMAGALVFPGGAVDPSDGDPGYAEAGAFPDLKLRIAAIREVFEEAGLLLARRKGETALVAPDRLIGIEARHRDRLNRGEIGFPAVLAAEDLVAAPDVLVRFAHWITPKALPKRFDTQFFVTRAPEGQLGLHDDRELVGSRWVRPADALAEAAAKRIQVVPVTRFNLQLLDQSTTVDDALAAAAGRTIITVEPVVTPSPDGPVIRIPREAGYGITEMPFRNH